jgi:hypothetical protein
MADATIESVHPTQAPPPPSPRGGKAVLLRRIGFVFGLLGLGTVFVLLRSQLPSDPRTRTLIGTGVLAAGGASAFFLFGKETQGKLQAWRIFFCGWGLLLAPLLITIALGVAEQGWPSGKVNRPIVRLLTWVLVATIPAFLTSLLALTRSHRLTAVLAMVSGLASLACSRSLFIETAPIKLGAMLPLDNVLHIIGFLSKLVAFASIPAGIAMVVGGCLTLRAAKRATAAG